jgi:hypothetical protein
MILRNCVLLLLFLFPQYLRAQSVYAPLNQDYYHWVNRYEIKQGRWAEGFHSQIKPYLRKGIVALVDSATVRIDRLTKVDEFNLAYLKNDSWEWATDSTQGLSKKAILKQIYKRQNDFYSHKDKDFEVHINPVIAFSLGQDNNSRSNPYLSSRGIEIRGSIANRIGFYTYFTDTQALFPTYVTNEIIKLNAIPNEGYYKRDIGGSRVDFITARGYLTFDIVKKINVQFGYDKNFIGNGYRSLVLSDYSSNYLFLKLNTKVWKINYENIFAQLTALTYNADGYYPKKYMAYHHLSINITKNFNIGFFENIIFGRSDTLVNTQGYDLNYLNPIIFYRSVEQQLGSPDNANLGIDFQWNFLRHFQLYGQIFIDELKVGEVRSGKGWWGNKQAVQLGFKYIDAFGIRNLDLQGETNIVRPFTYTHNSNFRNYTNYQQALAHPLGANFYEFVGIVRYQPFPRLMLVAKGIYTKYGADQNNSNVGNDIFLNYDTKQKEYGNYIGQGLPTTLLYADFTASWHLRHNLFVELKYIYRKIDSALTISNNTTNFFSLQVRWNIANREYAF